MDVKTIDLEDYNGVTLCVELAGVLYGEPFYISIKEPGTGRIWYERIYDKSKVSINLPKHSKEVSLAIVGRPTIAQYYLTDLQRLEIPYPSEIEKTRPFNISEIRVADNLEMQTPGRFYTRRPLIEFNPRMMSKYSQQVNLFIRLHELGHFFFTDEEKADEWATTTFLNLGYNLSSANQALTQVLSKSPVNMDRMYAQHEYLNAINNQYFES